MYNYIDYGNYSSSSNGDVFLGIVFLILLVIWYSLPIILSAVIADHKGRNVGGWIVCALFLGWISVIIVACLNNEKNTNHHLPTPRPYIRDQQKYLPYKCARCGERIDTVRCAYCGCEHKPESLRKAPMFTKTTQTPQSRWYCECGANNSDSSTECAVCFKQRPSK